MSQSSTFFLKKISHREVFEAYLAGEFSTLTTESGKNIEVSSRSAIITEEFSSDPHRAIFIDAISKYTSPILYSSNQKAFDVHKIGGNNTTEMCDWCNAEKATTGMVVAYKKEYFYVESTKKNLTMEVFWIYGNHCTVECALGELEWTRKSGSPSLFNTESSITLTKLLFTLMTGKDASGLSPTPYFRLLKNRGGSLEKKDGHKYIANPNIIQLPAKIAFERINV